MQVCKFLPVQYGASCPLKKNNVAIHNISMSPFIFTARYYNENEDSNKKKLQNYTIQLHLMVLTSMNVSSWVILWIQRPLGLN